VRYYGTDGKQRNEFLAEKDDKHHSKTCKPVKDLSAKAMSRVNANSAESALSPLASEFWLSVYLPHCERSLRPSTVHSYKDLWERFLKQHLGSTRLGEYKAHNATEFLTSLSGRLGRNSLSHVRSLLSGFFSHATALGKIEHNPIRDAKVLTKPKPPQEAEWYDLGQLEDIVRALKEDPAAQLVVLLAGVMGLRPSEIVGLDWTDFSQGSLHIRRAVVRGVSGGTKTASSVASIPVIQPVAGLLKLWHETSGRPDQGWVFPEQEW
jgi:integrase